MFAIFKVTLPDEPPPDNPVPAVTPVISPPPPAETVVVPIPVILPFESIVITGVVV
mgnify:CR=1 FL=1